MSYSVLYTVVKRSKNSIANYFAEIVFRIGKNTENLLNRSTITRIELSFYSPDSSNLVMKSIVTD